MAVIGAKDCDDASAGAAMPPNIMAKTNTTRIIEYGTAAPIARLGFSRNC